MRCPRIVIFVTINVVFIGTMAATYGKFQVFVNGFDSCKGPRRKDCASAVGNVRPGGRMLEIDLEAFEDSVLDVNHHLSGFTVGVATPCLTFFVMNKDYINLIVGDCVGSTIHIHIAAYKSEDSAKRSAPIMSMKLDNPCDQALLKGTGNIWALSGNVCLVKKGTYNMTVDAWNLAQKLWTGNFFYGNFTFKCMFYGPKCNLWCIKLNVTYSPIQ